MIPARSGSKGLVDKNIIEIVGKPLISFAIEPLLECQMIHSVYINSDCDSYLEIGSQWGAKQYKRQKNIALDNSSMKEVINDFINNEFIIEKDFEILLVLYPTHPIWKTDSVEKMIKKFLSMGSNRPFIGLIDAKTHPYLCYHRDSNGHIKNIMGIDENKYYRRQQYPKYFQISGGLYIMPISKITSLNAQLISNESYGYIIPNEETHVDIDTQDDLTYFKYLKSNL